MAQALGALRRRIKLVANNSDELRQCVESVLGPLAAEPIGKARLQALLNSLGVTASKDAVSDTFTQLGASERGTITLAQFCDSMFPTNRLTISRADDGGFQSQGNGRSYKGSGSSVSDPKKLLKLLESKMTRNVSGVARAYRHFRGLARGNGSDIDAAGFKKAIQALGIRATPECAAALFRTLDPNHSGTIDLNEFIKGVLHSAGGPTGRTRGGRNGRTAAKTALKTRGSVSRPLPTVSPSRKAEPVRREMMPLEKMATHIMQLREKFMQHGGKGHKAMLRTWQKLRVFSNARVPNLVTYTEFDKGLKVCSAALLECVCLFILVLSCLEHEASSTVPCSSSSRILVFQAMGVPLPPKVVAAVFTAIDVNSSGTIDFKEFARYVFPQEMGLDASRSADWQKLGAATLAARRSNRIQKTLGLIRDPAVLQATIKRKVRTSGKTASKAFRRFRQAIQGDRGTAGGVSYVINCDDFKKALAHMQITATGACVETLFRHIDVDQSGAIDFQEFVDSLMQSAEKQASIAVKNAIEKEVFTNKAVSLNAIEDRRAAVQKRIEDELHKKIEHVQSDDIDEFMASMRSRLGNGRDLERAASRQREASYNYYRVPRSSESSGDSMGLGIVGQGQSRDRLPRLNQGTPEYVRSLQQGSSKVNKKAAAASARRAQLRLVKDRNPNAAAFVAQASLLPQYEKPPLAINNSRSPERRH